MPMPAIMPMETGVLMPGLMRVMMPLRVRLPKPTTKLLLSRPTKADLKNGRRHPWCPRTGHRQEKPY
ncbi:hypothetical protein JYU34_015485 [Plutella xylostella]|uniref:Uncharacterized protein n=1 Tax=Plutella xylostella TaxID=51655 RepID=A0ABQ7Q779_PLUXY|nr:hypothetical protein JYU34_015485 [Plutella xylostella]